MCGCSLGETGDCGDKVLNSTGWSPRNSSTAALTISQHCPWDGTRFHLTTPDRCGEWSPTGDEGIVLSEPETRSRGRGRGMLIFTSGQKQRCHTKDAQLSCEKAGFLHLLSIWLPHLHTHTHIHTYKHVSPPLASLLPPQWASRLLVPPGCGCTLWSQTHSSQEPSVPVERPERPGCQRRRCYSSGNGD